MTLFFLLLACQQETSKDSLPAEETDADTDSDSDTDADTDADTDTETTTTYIEPGTLRGEVVEDPFLAPDFSGVLNFDEAPRSRDDLEGHPTVIWFYPAANTGG